MSEGHVGYFVRFDSVGMMILGVWQAYTGRESQNHSTCVFEDMIVYVYVLVGYVDTCTEPDEVRHIIVTSLSLEIHYILAPDTSLMQAVPCMYSTMNMTYGTNPVESR